MNHSEGKYIAICKRLIEEKFRFENNNGLRQRDLETLSDSIEEKSAIRLSLSTLKRLWKADYDQTPHPSTLQAMVSVLGYKDWNEFKAAQTFVLPQDISVVMAGKKRRYQLWMLLPLVLLIPLLLWLNAFRSKDAEIKKPVVKGEVVFTGNKTVSQGVPSTIIFNYDVRNVEADSFFFQQSWNYLEKVKINPKAHHYSNIYYYPGFHKAKLIANDSILKIFRVHITTDGWLPMVRYSLLDNKPIYIPKDRLISKGYMHITPDILAGSKVNFDNNPVLSYYNVREFGATDSDHFSLETSISCDRLNTVPCPGVEVVIMCEAHIFYVRIMGRGCERDNGVKMGEVVQDGVNNDLSVFGRDLYKMQNLKIEVVEKRASIFLDGIQVHSVTFQKDFGKVVGLVYNFLGTGAVDYVKLKGRGGDIVYEEHFD